MSQYHQYNVLINLYYKFKNVYYSHSFILLTWNRVRIESSIVALFSSFIKQILYAEHINH